MLAAEIVSTAAKPSMILERNLRVGSLIDGNPVRASNPTSTPRLHSENPRDRGANPDPVGKTTAEWIKGGKFGADSKAGCGDRAKQSRRAAIPGRCHPVGTKCGPMTASNPGQR